MGAYELLTVDLNKLRAKRQTGTQAYAINALSTIAQQKTEEMETCLLATAVHYFLAASGKTIEKNGKDKKSSWTSESMSDAACSRQSAISGRRASPFADDASSCDPRRGASSLAHALRGRAADREDKRPGMVKPGTGAATVRVGMLQALPVQDSGAQSPARRDNSGKCS